MSILKKIFQKLFREEGYLKEVFAELKWITRYSVHFRREIILYVVIGLLSTAASFGLSIFSKKIIDTVTGYDTSAIAPVAVFYVVFNLLQIAFNSIISMVRTKINIRVEQEIRADVYDKIMQADWISLISQRSGDMLNRLNGDVSSVSSSVLGWVPDLVTRMFQFIGAFGIICYYDWVLAVFSLLSAPFMALMSRSLLRKMRHYNSEMRNASSDLMSFSEESFRNIQLIKSFGLSDQYGGELRKVQQKYRDLALEYNRFSVGTTALLSIIGMVVYICCYGWCIYRLWTHSITYGTMTLFLQLSGTLGGAFSSLVSMVPSAISAATAAGRIMAISELPKEEKPNDAEVAEILREGKTANIHAENISFAYNDDEFVFENADFKAKSGEIVAIVGSSGEGKTTFLRLLLGLIPISGGKMYISDSQGMKIPVSPSTRALFAYVPQENMMFAKSVRDNLRLMKPEATDDELNKALDTALAYRFVYKKEKNLDTPVLEAGGGFSEGQIQRLTIARALLQDAPIMLLDEATSALDIGTEQEVLQNIMSVRQNRIIIVTTHRPSVLKLCDRVYRLQDKKIEILSKEEIKAMYDSFSE